MDGKLAQRTDAAAPTADKHPATKGKKRESAHIEQANRGHCDFLCDCALARGRGQRSCLKQFTGEQLMEFHKESFGVYVCKDSKN